MQASIEGGRAFLEAVLDAIPVPVMVVDPDMRITLANQATRRMLDRTDDSCIRMRGGEALGCLNSTLGEGGCGGTPACTDCVIRGSVEDAVEGRKVVRHKARLEIVDDAGHHPVHMLVTASPLEDEDLALLVLEDIGELVELKSILPVCAGCHKIRDDDEYWHSVESYFHNHLDVDFSHGLCPDCIARLYPDFNR